MVKIPSNIFYIGIFKEHNYEEMHVVQPLELKNLDLFWDCSRDTKNIQFMHNVLIEIWLSKFGTP